jgi:hypothetical protein
MRFAVLFAVGLTVVTSAAWAQSDEDDDEMDYLPLSPSGNYVHFGNRILGGPKVAFGQLGNVTSTRVTGDDTGAGLRYYEDGTVNADARVDRNGVLIDDGYTNSWTFNNQSQVTSSGGIAFNAYSATTSGATARAKKGYGAGWEMVMGKSLGRIGGKATLTLVGGMSFTSINAKANGMIPAALHILTDTYSLAGQVAPTAPYTAPSSLEIPLMDVNGNPVLGSTGVEQVQTIDNTVLLSSQPSRSYAAGTASVMGHWQIKGAYYTFRVGPSVRLPLSERLKINFGLGAAVLYLGTRYIAEEELILDELTNPAVTLEEKTRQILLPAAYADLDAEYWLTDRTGFYLGASVQKSGSYDQTVGGRTARIQLGTSAGFQTGMSLRF